MKRFHQSHIHPNTLFDIIIIGGGATGLGIAVDAASRGYKTLLLEQADFAKGTSSRSTKLVHGGVRYLAQGDIRLVKSALRERGILLRNAPHLVKKEAFLIPCYSWLAVLKYLVGLTVYDWLSGKHSFGNSRFFSKKDTLAKMTGIKAKQLKGSISYCDGTFDDARLAVNLAKTAIEHGASLLHYTKVTALKTSEQGKISGVLTEDAITGLTNDYSAKVVINATGVFVDDIVKMANPEAAPMVRPSQGVHIVINREFLSSNDALMIPKTADGRVLFAVPWHGSLLVGTTDTPLNNHSMEPKALKEEIDFILQNAGNYLVSKPVVTDVKSVFAGLRPLAAQAGKALKSTKEVSRDHKLVVGANGLITITGGKWTTYRLMAEQTVDAAVACAGLKKLVCITSELAIHGSTRQQYGDRFDIYGTDALKIKKLISESAMYAEKLHPLYDYVAGEVVWFALYEMAETVEDILCRRFRILFIDAKVAMEMAPKVASILADVFNFDKEWENQQIESFNSIAIAYLPL